MGLIRPLLDRVEEQDRREQEAAEAKVAEGLLAERDYQLLEFLRTAQAPPRFLKLVEDHLAADRRARRPADSVARRLELSEAARMLLRQLREHRLDALRAEARQLLEHLSRVSQEREDVARALAATPNEEDIRLIVDRFKTATEKVAVLQEKADRLKAALEAKRDELRRWEGQLHNLVQGQVDEEFRREDARRLVQLAGRTRQTMEEFLRRATRHKIDRLSALITESFRYLLHKQTLVERIWIDPDTFAITLYDAAGAALARQRLSEGEKQIFAVAMLWGLARAAARPLPAVIDTPMARLDAAHRRHLVERYFPSASHQVVILSTDTEVDRAYYQAPQPSIARAYHLDYDERTRVTVAREGYFWQD